VFVGGKDTSMKTERGRKKGRGPTGRRDGKYRGGEVKERKKARVPRGWNWAQKQKKGEKTKGEG